MDAIRIFLIVIFFTPIFSFGQELKYPKDTIYVKFEKKEGQKKWHTKYSLGGFVKNGKYIDDKEKGIAFNLKDINNQSMLFFYNKKQKLDTLCITYLKNYKSLNLKEIRKKHNEWINELYNGQRKPPADKNGAFHTFLIEIISKEKFVIYPVIWRSEGVID